MDQRIEICALASGSNGNCYYVGNSREAILIDAGISTKQVLLRMKERRLDPRKVKALFITHEHSDHVCGARVLEKRLHIPVYMTARTYIATYKNQQPANPRFFTPGAAMPVGEFLVHSFLKNHDAAEPCSFRVEYAGRSVGVCTDIGEPCDQVMTHVKRCDALFLESNYDEEMLRTGSYPYYLKQRVGSAHGHLSNDQAARLLEEHAGEQLKCVFLSHLSKENNTPEKALVAMQPLTHRFEVLLTSRYQATEVYLL